MSMGRPAGMGAMALGSHIPPSLGVVPQLVQEIAQSMARARMKYATVALGLSITCLGGAAEAMRHLPDSIRPNLEFLSPSKAIENLFRRHVPVPRLESTPGTDRPQIAHVETDDSTPGHDYPSVAPLVPIKPTIARSTQQVLAFKLQTPVPPVSTHTPHLDVKPTTGANPSPTVQTTTLARIDAGKPEPQRDAPSRQFQSVADAGSNSDARPAKAEPTYVAPVSAPAVSHRDPNAAAVASYLPPPSALRKSSSNLDRVEGVETLTSMLLGNTDAPVPAGPEQLTFAADDGVGGFTATAGLCAAEWLTLRPSDIYAHPGDGTYAWSDAAHGITQGGVNSATITLHGASDFGVINIAKLANNTTLAPDRPTGHTFIGIWSVESLLQYSGIDLSVRYDDVLAESLGKREEDLKLWIYDGTEWSRIMDSTFARDLENHTLSGSWTNGTIEYFGVSAPEPGAVFGMLVGGACALLRRQRRL
jgi:hypothetical protein